jgi:hypothetical protein
MRRWPHIVASLLVLGATAGCGTAASGPTPGGGANQPPPPAAVPSTDYSTVDNQYRGIQFGLNLPPGVTFPAHLAQSGTGYESNAGTVAAQNFWFCAWLWAYLDGKSGAAQQVPKFVRMDAYTKALDDRGRAAIDTVVHGVAKGDKAPVTGFVKASCGGPFYGSSHP